MTNPGQDQEPMEPPTTPQEPEKNKKKPFYKRGWFNFLLTMIVVIFFAGIGSSLNRLTSSQAMALDVSQQAQTAPSMQQPRNINR